MTDLEQLFEAARDFASATFKEVGEVVPFWMAETASGEKIGIATPWDGPEAKDAAVEVVREMFSQWGVVRYAFLAEAWQVEGRNDMTLRPSQHPERKEVVSIVVCDNNGETRMGNFYILRPEHGTATLSEFKAYPTRFSSGGTMANLLQPRHSSGTVH